MKDITIDVTYAELNALIAVNGLFQGVNYLITDRGDRGLLFKAASTSQLEIQGTRYMLCPATYAIGADAYGNNWIGVWNSTKTAVLDDLTIWNGQVWKCILAVTEPLDSPDLNDVNWVLIPKQSFSNFEYIEMIFTVSYDVANDWICKQRDLNNNEAGCSYLAEQAVYAIGYNTCDRTDWNYASSGYEFFNNQCLEISNNDCLGIMDNHSNATINGNYNIGNIQNCTSGVNQCYSLTDRFAIQNLSVGVNGEIITTIDNSISSLSVFADNAAAVLAGLKNGMLYKLADQTLKVVSL